MKQQFKKQGYTQVTSKQLREFVETFLWKKQKPNTSKQQKNDIMNVTPNQYFDYCTMKIQMNQINIKDIDLTKL